MLVSPYKVVSSCQKAVNPAINKTGRFLLLDKTQKQSVLDSHIRPFAPENADTYTSVTVGKSDDINFRKKVTTFYSGDGEVVRKVLEATDEPTIVRDYEVDSGYLEGGAFSKLKKITTKVFDEDIFKFKLKSSQEQKIYKTPDRKFKLQINENKINKNDIKTSVTEYPWVEKGKSPEGAQKVLAFDMHMDKGIPQITDAYVKNIKFQESDKYLPYRMIFDDSLKRFTLAKFLLKEKGLEPLQTVVKFSKRLGSDVAAYFSESENVLVFNPNAKNDSVKLAAHEVQHAFQFAQIGRLGKSKSNYGIKSKEVLGEITNPEETKEALKFYIAAEKYPNIDTSCNLKQSPDYINNYLEENANKEAQRVYDEYTESGKILGKQLFFGDI